MRRTLGGSKNRPAALAIDNVNVPFVPARACDLALGCLRDARVIPRPALDLSREIIHLAAPLGVFVRHLVRPHDEEVYVAVRVSFSARSRAKQGDIDRVDLPGGNSLSNPPE